MGHAKWRRFNVGNRGRLFGWRADMNADRQTSNEDGVNAEGFVAGGAFWGGCKVSESDVAHVWTPPDFPPNWGRARKFKCPDRS